MTENIASISDLKSNPMGIVGSNNGQAVAILNRNKPVFYAVPVEHFEHMLEIIEDIEIFQTVKDRQDQASLKVSLDDL